MISAKTLIVALLFLVVMVVPTRVVNTEKLEDATTASFTNNGEVLLSYIKMKCDEHKIPVRLVHNIIKVESKWRYPKDGEVVGSSLVCSTEDAYGLMQVQLMTAQEMMETDTITRTQLMDDNILNVESGIRYISWLRKYYHGNWYFAIAAYNRGIRGVNQDIRNGLNPINGYVNSVTNGVFFGKKTTEKMEIELSKLREKASFQDAVIAEVALRLNVQ